MKDETKRILEEETGAMIIAKLDQIKISVREKNLPDVLFNVSHLFLALLVSVALVNGEDDIEQYLKSALSMLFLDAIEIAKNTNRKKNVKVTA